MVRTTFSDAERAKFTRGAAVSWRHKGKWHPAIVVGGIATGHDGIEYVLVKHMGATVDYVDAGDRVNVQPGGVR